MNILAKDWRQVWRYYSTWALALLAVMPEIYAALVAAGVVDGREMPDVASWIVRAIAVAGIVGRFVSQTRPDGLPPHVGDAESP